MRPRLALAGALGQSDRARQLSEGALVSEEAPIRQLGTLTRAANRQGAVLEVDGDRLLRYAGEVERIHELAFGLPDIKRRCPHVVGESAGAGGRFEHGLDQPLELAVHRDTP